MFVIFAIYDTKFIVVKVLGNGLHGLTGYKQRRHFHVFELSKSTQSP